MKYENIDSIIELIANPEGNQLEFKETTGQLERSMETLCAFLNSFGGTVLFGVNDKGKIIGQDVSDKTKRDIASAIKLIEPLTEIPVSYVQIPGSNKYVIALSAVDARKQRPFMYNGRAYYRVESVTTKMPQSDYNQLVLLRDGAKYPWEAFDSQYLTIADIDENEVLGTVRAGIQCGRLPENTIKLEIPTILEKFGLLVNGKLNNAAAVLFAKNDVFGYPQCKIRLARFKGVDKREFVDNQHVFGNIFTLIDAAMAFVFKHLSLSGKVEKLQREEQLSIPYKAIRECIINALCHRDYRDRGATVGIAIYDDRVEIENKCAFANDVDMNDTLNRNVSRPFNPLIAEVMYRSNFLENWGRGVSLMVEECENVGLPAPTFKLVSDFVVVTFKYNTYQSRGQAEVKQESSRGHVEVKSVKPHIQDLVDVLKNDSLSISEMMQLLSLASRASFRKRHLLPAIENGFVEPIFPDQPKHPKQKYRLTDKGKGLLK